MAKRFKRQQIDALNLAYEGKGHLTKQKKNELVEATGLDMEQVASWFSRRRAHERAKESRRDLEQRYAKVRQDLQASEEREAKLQQDLDESKKREGDLIDEILQLKQQLGILLPDSDNLILRFVKGYAWE